MLFLQSLFRRDYFVVRTEGNPSWIGFCLFLSCLGLPSALALSVSGCCCLLERPALVEGPKLL